MLHNNEYQEIFKVVENELGITKDEIISKNRSREFVEARALFSLIAREKLFKSYPTIAKQINKDHTTVMSVCKKYKDIEWIKRILNEYSNIRETLNVIPMKIHGRYHGTYTKYSGKCAVCQFDEVVEIHHIKARRFGGDDDPENLILLCPNHHALADKGMINIKDINKVN